MSAERNRVIEVAQKYAAKGQLDKALVEYHRLVREDPSDVRTLLKVGDLYTRKGAREEACQTYTQVAEHYASQGFFLKAVAVYKQILKLDATRIETFVRLSSMYEHLQLTSDALKALEHVAALYSKQGNLERVITILNRMCDLDPQNLPARIKYAEALSQAGRTAEAAAQFSIGATQLRQHGRIDDYVRVAERLFFHRPNDADVARDLATCYLDRDDPKRALAKLQVCFKADPKDLTTLELLVNAFEKLGQRSKTISVYREMARIQRDARDEESRARTLRRILELSPDDQEANEALREIETRAQAAAGYGDLAHEEIEEVELEEIEEVELATAEDDAGPTAFGEAFGARAESSAPTADAESRQRAEPSRQMARATGSDLPTREFEATAPEDDADHEESASTAQDVAPLELKTKSGPRALEGSGSHQSPGDARSRPSSLPPDVAREALIARLLTECDVFLRYGLKGKVVAQLQRVLELDSSNVEARERLKELYLEQGMHDKAIEQLYALADLFRQEAPHAALVYARQIVELDPTSKPAVSWIREDKGRSVQPAPEVRPEHREDENDDEDVLFLEDEDENESQAERPGVRSRPPASGPIATDRAPGPDLGDVLEEAEFFIAQQLWNEARTTLNDALRAQPGHPALLEKLQELPADKSRGAPDELSGVTERPSAAESETSDEEEGADESFLLAEKLAEEVDELEVTAAGRDVLDAESVFAEFKRGIEETISQEDSDTHFDLGIAYKEMGLLDDAMGEFELAGRMGSRECIAHTMIGMCLLEKGDVEQAIASYRKGLQSANKSEREELGLYYEMGAAYQLAGDVPEALGCFQQCAARDPDFRDVQQRIRQLRQPKESTADAVDAAIEIEDLDRAFDDLITEGD